VKVLWENVDSSEITWEKVHDIRSTYPECLVEAIANFEGKIILRKVES
jgi:hypothetical protein